MKKTTKSLLASAALAATLLTGFAPGADASTRDAVRETNTVELGLRVVVVEDNLGLKTVGDSGGSEAKPEGDCSGVDECNIMISDCIAAGGEFEEEHHNPQGEPNLGHCN